MKDILVRADGSRYVVTADGVDHVVENFKWVPYMVGCLARNEDGVLGVESVTVNGIPLKKWVLMW